MARFGLQLLGDAELANILAGLTDRVERKILARAFREAAVGTLRVAQANISLPKARLFPGHAGSTRRAKAARRFALKHVAQLRNHLHVVALRRKTHRIGYRVVTGTREEFGIPATSKYYYPAHVEFGHAAPHRGRFARVSATTRALYLRELGGKRTPPHPYLRPALKSREGQILAGLHLSIRAGIARENLRSG